MMTPLVYLMTMPSYGHLGIFDPALRNIAPLTFSLTNSPTPRVKVQHIETVCGWMGVGGRGGGLSPVGDHILQVFNSLYLTRFRTGKIARQP
jgi:hypothetical protein